MLSISVSVVLVFILLLYVFDCCSHGYKFKDMIKFITMFKASFFCDEKAKEKLEKFKDFYDSQREYDNQMMQTKEKTRVALESALNTMRYIKEADNQIRQKREEMLGVAMEAVVLNTIRCIEKIEEKEKYKNIKPEIYVDYSKYL